MAMFTGVVDPAATANAPEVPEQLGPSLAMPLSDAT
jgi:hypothetical protein